MVDVQARAADLHDWSVDVVQVERCLAYFANAGPLLHIGGLVDSLRDRRRDQRLGHHAVWIVNILICRRVRRWWVLMIAVVLALAWVVVNGRPDWWRV